MSRIKNPKAKQARLAQSAAAKADRDAGAWERVSSHFQQQMSVAHANGIQQGLGIDAAESIRALVTERDALRGIITEAADYDRDCDKADEDPWRQSLAKADTLPRAVIVAAKPSAPAPAPPAAESASALPAAPAGEAVAEAPH